MGEVALIGVSASPGVATGQAVVLGGSKGATDEVIPAERRLEELQRARQSLQSTADDFQQIAAKLRQRGWSAEAEIVETGILMAQDPALLGRLEQLIVGEGRPAPAAIQAAADENADLLADLPDPGLAQRADDVRSLGRRAAAHAAVGPIVNLAGILVANDLGPADVADMGLSAQGVALAEGGVTAHAAIVARSLGIPMVVGLGAQVLNVATGEELVLDGDQGALIRRPESRRVADAQEHGNRRRQAREAARSRRDEPALTVDGHRVTVLTNAASMAEAIEGFEQGAEGIGLLRTELPFLDAPSWPSTRRQIEFMKPILDRLVKRPATVRLFDFGADKTPPFLRGVSARGIDLILGEPGVLETQLAAIVEAAGDHDVRILVPMVTSAEQVRQVRAAIRRVVKGRKTPQLGPMIETPEAALQASDIAAESDFFSIGTNDLTQLVLGLDRERSRTAPMTDPRVLPMIAAAVRAGHGANIKVDVCGEAASDQAAMPILVGLGVDELSVAPARVGQVKQWIRELDFAEAERESEALLHQSGHAGRERV